MITKDVEAPYPWDRFARSTERGFLNVLERELTPVFTRSVARAHRATIVARADEVFDTRRAYIVDKPAQSQLLLLSYVLAAYRTLEEEVADPKELLTILERAVCEPGSSFVAWAMRFSLFFARDKMDMMVRQSGRKATLYGQQFVMEAEGSEADCFTLRVTRCGFHAFFQNEGLPGPTAVFCSWDKLWYEQIKPSRDGVVFSLSETIADGGRSCPFKTCRVGR